MTNSQFSSESENQTLGICTKEAVHPGRILHREFMRERNLSSPRLALGLGLAPQRVAEIISGNRGITAETALRFAKYFNTSAEFWMSLQSDYELRLAETKWRAIIDREVAPGRFLETEPDTCAAQKRHSVMQIDPLHPVLGSAGSAKVSNSEAAPNLTGIRIEDPEHREVYRLLRANPMRSFDSFVELAPMPVGPLMGALTMLEVAGLVKREGYSDVFSIIESCVMIEDDYEEVAISPPEHPEQCIEQEADGLSFAPKPNLEVTGHVPDQESDGTDGTY